MRLTILFSGMKQVVEGTDLNEILGKLGTNIESVIVLKDKKVILEQDVSDGDEIELVNVISGG